jgi:hypothetical protein
MTRPYIVHQQLLVLCQLSQRRLICFVWICFLSIDKVHAFHIPSTSHGAKQSSTRANICDVLALHSKEIQRCSLLSFSPLVQYYSYKKQHAPSRLRMVLDVDDTSVTTNDDDDEWHPNDPAWTTPQLLEGIWSQIAQGKNMIRNVCLNTSLVYFT